MDYFDYFKELFVGVAIISSYGLYLRFYTTVGVRGLLSDYSSGCKRYGFGRRLKELSVFGLRRRHLRSAPPSVALSRCCAVYAVSISAVSTGCFHTVLDQSLRQSNRLLINKSHCSLYFALVRRICLLGQRRRSVCYDWALAPPASLLVPVCCCSHVMLRSCYDQTRATHRLTTKDCNLLTHYWAVFCMYL